MTKNHKFIYLTFSIFILLSCGNSEEKITQKVNNPFRKTQQHAGRVGFPRVQPAQAGAPGQ